MTDVMKIIQNTTLTYHQKVLALARLAESYDHESLPIKQEYENALKLGTICDLGEGRVPYRPRYITPDYEVLMRNGSKTLEIKPPKTIDDALTALLIMYHHVPSITSFPVYLGNLDDLLEPFVKLTTNEYAKDAIKRFLMLVDKTQLDSFVHANLGPSESITGNIILELTEEMQLAIPNISLKYDSGITSDDFALKAINTMLKTAKPSFANHKMFVSEWGAKYAIASCYNGLLIGGGGYTLHRLVLGTMAKQSKNLKDFITNVLPKHIEILLNAMEDRIKFIVEKSTFFETSFLVKENFITKDKLIGMFGVVGLAECVNYLLGITNPKKGYGLSQEANDLGIKIMEIIKTQVTSFESKYCKATGHKYGLHAQVGIDTDGGDNSPGPRIPIGVEPAINEQIVHSMNFHKYFTTGCGDVFKFDQSWTKTPDAILDIIKGAMNNNFRYFSGYNEDSDVVRVTGYLVKKSELAKLDNNETSLNNVTAFGKGARDSSRALDRRIQSECSNK